MCRRDGTPTLRHERRSVNPSTPSDLTPRSRTPRTRFVVYLSALVLVPIFAFFAGMSYFNAVECTNGGECDLGGLIGIVWAFFALVLVVLAVGVTELVLAFKRRKQRTHG